MKEKVSETRRNEGEEHKTWGQMSAEVDDKKERQAEKEKKERDIKKNG